MDMLWKFIPTPAKIGLFVALFAALFTFGAVIYSNIWNRGYAAHLVVAEAEKLAIRKANEKAIADANASLEADISRLLLANEKVSTSVFTLDVEASKDPNALSECLSADSVRRINSVR